MRHLGSILLALVAAPVAFVLAGRGLQGLAEAAEADRTDYFAIVTSATALGFAGLLFALLTMARFSPLGPTLAGAGYVAVGVWALDDPDGLLATVPDPPIGLADDQLTAAAAVAPLLAAPLLLTLFLPRRWRGRERPAELAPVQPAEWPDWPAPERVGPPIALVAPPTPAPYQPPVAPPPSISVPPSPPPPPWRPISPHPPAPPAPAAPAVPVASQPTEEPTDVLPNNEPTVTPSSVPPWPPMSGNRT